VGEGFEEGRVGGAIVFTGEKAKGRGQRTWVHSVANIGPMGWTASVAVGAPQVPNGEQAPGPTLGRGCMPIGVAPI
jgi:hypothetical protein